MISNSSSRSRSRGFGDWKSYILEEINWTASHRRLVSSSTSSPCLWATTISGSCPRRSPPSRDSGCSISTTTSWQLCPTAWCSSLAWPTWAWGTTPWSWGSSGTWSCSPPRCSSSAPGPSSFTRCRAPRTRSRPHWCATWPRRVSASTLSVTACISITDSSTSSSQTSAASIGCRYCSISAAPSAACSWGRRRGRRGGCLWRESSWDSGVLLRI